MADGDITLFAGKPSDILPFQDRIIEHTRRPDEIDAMVGEIPSAMIVLPLEHKVLYAGPTRPSRGL